MVKIAVVGAGVSGLSTACCIQQRHPYADITVFGEKLSPYTTGDVAAGLWAPYLCGENPSENIIKWSGKTYEHLLRLWNTPEAGEMGITLMPCYKANNDPVEWPVPQWKDVVLGFRKMSAAELRLLNKPDLRQGFVFTTIICECSKYLPGLLKKFQRGGGKLIQKRVGSLQELGSEFDVVVNCAGIGAHELVSDKTVFPIRGQVMRVKAPGLCACILDESDNGGYIIPNHHRVILGGTRQEHDWNLRVDERDRSSIVNACNSLIPALKTAPVVDEIVGLRPARPTVRLELEIMESNARTAFGNRKPFVVVHNYGHGGSGITLAWGCALDACALVEKGIRELQSELRSKL